MLDVNYMICLCVSRSFSEGDVVQSKYGDGVVVCETMTGFGWHYTIEVFESGEMHEVTEDEIEKIDPFDNMFFEDLIPDEAWDSDAYEDEETSETTDEATGATADQATGATADAGDDDLPSIPPAETKRRFVVPESSDAVDELADERQAKFTQAQTR